MTRLVCLSDSHGSHFGIKIPDGDILVHSGDFCSHGRLEDAMSFLNWFNSHPHPKKIFIAGNHDWICEKDPNMFQVLLKQFPDLTYLENSGCEVEGLKFWGSPMTPTFYNWAFNRDRGEDIKKHWDKIPDGTDVLITHGPPYGYCDEAYRVGFDITEHVGCKDLLDAINRVKPKIWIGGHIHYSYGIGNIIHDDRTRTVCYNSSLMNENYMVENKPHIINI